MNGVVVVLVSRSYWSYWRAAKNYVPLLSAIQIFMKKPAPTSSNEENDFVALQYDSSSDDDESAKSNTGFCKDNLYVNFFETGSP